MTPLFRWFSRCCAMIAVCALAGCVDEGATPITPKAIVVTGGDGQTGPFGQELAQRLTALVTGSDDHPLAGTAVQWGVTAGSATLAQPADTSDAIGLTANRLTPGFVAGDVTITATVTGLPPATFTAHVVDPCDYRPAHVLGDSDSAALSSLDCQQGAWGFIDYYALAVSGQRSFTLSLRSDSLDALLLFGDPANNLLAFSDDSGFSASNSNSFLRMIATGGAYSIGVNSSSHFETGPYELSSHIAPVTVDNCAQDVWVTRGISTVQQLASTDCVAAGPFYGDLYYLVLQAGQGISVTETSTAFDAYLELYGFDFSASSFVLVASDDNSGGGTDARLTYTAPQTNFFFIAASSANTGEVGAYTLTIAPPVAMAVASQVTPPADRLLVPVPLFKTRRTPLSWSRHER